MSLQTSYDMGWDRWTDDYFTSLQKLSRWDQTTIIRERGLETPHLNFSQLKAILIAQLNLDVTCIDKAWAHNNISE